MYRNSLDDTLVARFRSASARPVARLLTLDDIEKILELENEKWEENQAASAADIAARIQAYPELCIGAFCPRSGRILASLFLKPVAPNFWSHAKDWFDCVESAAPADTPSLFGISLSGREDGGVDAVSAFLWPHLAARGWRDVYLGSPIPGWGQWHAANPGRSVTEYVFRQRADGLPCDPQLRYYHRRGFKEIVCVKHDYFPHERSQDHGAIIRREVPQSIASPTHRERGEHGVPHGNPTPASTLQ